MSSPLCGEADLNGHASQHQHLKLACLPIPPSPRMFAIRCSSSDSECSILLLRFCVNTLSQNFHNFFLSPLAFQFSVFTFPALKSVLVPSDKKKGKKCTKNRKKYLTTFPIPYIILEYDRSYQIEWKKVLDKPASDRKHGE